MEKLPPNSAMIAIRREIDVIDEQLVTILASRQRLIERAVAAKTKEHLPARIQTRIDEVVNRVTAHAAIQNLSPELAKLLWTHMVEWFVEFEEEQLRKKR